MEPRYSARCPDTPRHWRSYPGAQGVIWHPCGMPPHMERAPSSFDPGNLAVLLKAFSQQPVNSHAAIDSVQLKTQLISPDDVGYKHPQSCSATSEPSLGGASDYWQSTGASSGSCDQGSVWPQVGCEPCYDQHALHTDSLSSQWGHGQTGSSLHGPLWKVRILCGLWSFGELLLTSLVPDKQWQLASGASGGCD